MNNHLKKAKDIFDSWDWQEWTLTAATLMIAIVLFSGYLEYKHVPSPVYGGDYYRDRGFVQNIVSGNPVWSDGFYVNEIQYYPYIYFAVQAGIVKLLNADVDKVFMFFPIIIFILSMIVWYNLGKTIFKNKTSGFVTALGFLGIIYFYYMKSAGLALFVLVPAFFLFWIKYEQEGKLKDTILAGLMLGLIALTWGGTFLSAVCMFAGTIIILFIIDSYKSYKEHKKIMQVYNIIIKYIKKYYLMAVIAVLVSLIFFLPLMLQYHLNEVNEVTKWGDTKIDLLGPKWLLGQLIPAIFNTSNLWLFILSIGSLAGLILLFLSKKNIEVKILLSLFFVNIITLQIHLITRPIFGFSFLPEKLGYLIYFSPLFLAYTLKFIYSKLKENNLRIGVIIIFAVIAILAFASRYSDFKEQQFESYGRQDNPYMDSLKNLGAYIEKNVAKDEAILGNDESGFMLAVLSGRKVMLTRRTHANYYVDIDMRIAEASVAMYGHDLEKTRAILQKYNVKYFYMDQYLFQNIMRTRPEFNRYLTENNIIFTQTIDRYDIALLPEQTNLREMLLIPPQNISEEFMSLWTKIYVVDVQGQVVGELYKLKE
ncbi:MAG: hypothetical protein ACP5NV_03325 [Candidatus Woesearchaeota archaeon]